ncbi:transmembrane protein 234 homolog [Dendroctonus ponderosae]|uniref:EamA domain-containing protein n=1 Tax=Dendroctonus ponderosae TaxID=77166 RepID=A0AAR5QK38_DENPD|nr:transmembrane protein 234 homolog [Dendroctonus ponderosae]KAH1011660.1 hypothetical protein HUJ04_000982 [Dendroctonus ponderosae]KAH1018410.1 hypothetical protein HUJ05_006189 [Dendroctonus ponderosae]
MLFEICMLTCVSALWGLTNPVIKRNSKSITKIKSNSALEQFLLDLKYLATNLDYLLPMGLNQIGSVLYFVTLQNMDLTLSVPIANSLTFIFTALSGSYLEESLPSNRVLTGAALILLGTCFCCYDKR